MKHYHLFFLLLFFAHLSFAMDRQITQSATTQESFAAQEQLVESPASQATLFSSLAAISSFFLYDRVTMLPKCLTTFCTASTMTEIVVDGGILGYSVYKAYKNIKLVYDRRRNNNAPEEV